MYVKCIVHVYLIVYYFTILTTLQASCLAIAITSGIAVSAIDDVFNPDLLDDSKHSHRYSEVAYGLIGLGVMGILILIIAVIIRYVCVDNAINHNNFFPFAYIVSFLTS